MEVKHIAALEIHLQVAFNRCLASIYPKAFLVVDKVVWNEEAQKVSIGISVGDISHLPSRASGAGGRSGSGVDKVTETIFGMLRQPFTALTEGRYEIILDSSSFQPSFGNEGYLTLSARVSQRI